MQNACNKVHVIIIIIITISAMSYKTVKKSYFLFEK